MLYTNQFAIIDPAKKLYVVLLQMARIGSSSFLSWMQVVMEPPTNILAHLKDKRRSEMQFKAISQT